MAKDENGNGIAYRGDIAGLSVYELWIEDRVVLEIAVDLSPDGLDAELPIYVGAPGAVAALIELDIALDDDVCLLQRTGGVARRATYTVGGGDGEVPDGLKMRVRSSTVQWYVLPRVVQLIADVYVPKSK